MHLTPEDSALARMSFRLWWSHDNFEAGPPPDVTEDIMCNFVGAYILASLDTMLFPDKSGNQV